MIGGKCLMASRSSKPRCLKPKNVKNKCTLNLDQLGHRANLFVSGQLFALLLQMVMLECSNSRLCSKAAH